MTSEIVPVSRSWELMPVVTVEVILKRREAILDIMRRVMQENVHYGKIPGTDKPTLLKPGAEVLCNTFGLCPRFPVESVDKDWSGERHNGEPFFGVQFGCELWRGDQLVATASGAANTWEKKHRWRRADRVCPKCHQPSIRKGKEEYGGGWICWKSAGGCGDKFGDNDPAITAQQIGNVPNPDVADLQNTIVKMGQKRALTAAILIATGASDIFTQDMEDFVDEATGETHQRPRQPAAPSSPARRASSPTPAASAAREPKPAPKTAPAGNGNDQADDIWPGPGQCPKCHAPEGKRHGKECLQ